MKILLQFPEGLKREALKYQEKYEKEGEIANVVFSCGAVVRGDTLFLYYGGADKVIGVATASLAHIIDALT